MEPALTWAIILLPLLAALVNGLAAGRLARPWPGLIACAALAGSLVLSDVPDNVLVYGSPAKIIRSRKPGERFLKSG